MECVNVRDAVGMTLCHDITKIVPGEFKGRLFKKGHIIKSEDIAKLLDIGKENIYVWDLQNGYTHENEAAMQIAMAASGSGVEFTEPNEGKVVITAAIEGLLKINVERLFEVNAIDQIVLSTIKGNRFVQKGKQVAGARIVPLVIEDHFLRQIEELCGGNDPIIEVKPFKSFQVGVITTGSEIYHGRIKDQFGPILKTKFEALGSHIMQQIFVPDSIEEIVKAVHDLLGKGADMIAVTGGMSVDPDDLSPSGIRAAGGKVITYGAPVLPGAMFMLAEIGDIPVVGLPGCVMYHKASVFDLVIPRILSGEKITREDITKLAYGGMCLACENCTYPDCSFGY
ncbi:MAG: molybdopterin-binding protein [Eubacteriales bacterium]